jgi:hypothetical protein
MKNAYDAPWSQRQAEKMYATLLECSRIVGLLPDDDDQADRKLRDLHEELRRTLAAVGLVAARAESTANETTPGTPLVRDRARQARIQRAWYPTTARSKSKA